MASAWRGGARLFEDTNDQRLDYLLEHITHTVPAEVACLYFLSRDGAPPELAAFRSTQPVTPAAWEVISGGLQGQMAILTNTSQASTYPFNAAVALGLETLLIYPIMLLDDVVAVVFLISSKPNAYTRDDLTLLAAPMQLLQTVVENMRLTERLFTTEAIAQTAQAIARNPSPQNIVHALRDYLFDVHISSCFIGLFGPVREDRPNGPFDYIEIEGSWSRRLGSKIGVGVRFDVNAYERPLQLLEEKKILTINNIVENLEPNADDFARMLVKVDNVQSLTMLLLESERGKLGIITITMDTNYELNPHELRAYQIVGEFLTMSTMAATLQRQADFVLQGRAALLDAVTDGVIMVLPDESATVLTVNDYFTRIFGLKEREVQGSALATLLEKMQIPASVRRDLYSQWQGQHAEGGELTGEFRMTTLYGTQIDIQWYSAIVYQDGDILGYIYTFHDITPERTAERLRSELLSRISHELRTPLTSIRGFAEFILEISGDQLPPIAREYTEIIHKSAIHLNHLFSDMIELTRANAGELKLQMRDTDLKSVIVDVITRMRPQSQNRQQTIVPKLMDNLPTVHIDVDRIDQVLTNLVSNAIKYSPEGGRIHVQMKYLRTQKQVPESAPPDVVTPCVLVSVLDEGKGLEGDEVNKVFLPFYRTRDARRDKIEGTGLGLAIAQSIVELHRGKIWAEPNQRRSTGGRFFFTIPTLE
ncbi:MAG: hypothetical protein OHK0046_43980 [Anaerolineae bacterium]